MPPSCTVPRTTIRTPGDATGAPACRKAKTRGRDRRRSSLISLLSLASPGRHPGALLARFSSVPVSDDLIALVFRQHGAEHFRAGGKDAGSGVQLPLAPLVQHPRQGL